MYPPDAETSTIAVELAGSKAAYWLHGVPVPTIDVVNEPSAVVHGEKNPHVREPSPTLSAHIRIVSMSSRPPLLLMRPSTVAL
eukprot:681794-Prymnesium_polylepis.3